MNEHEKGEVAVDLAIESFAETVATEQCEGYHSLLEPIEAYKARVKADIIESSTDLSKRFHRGYSIIIEELKRLKEQGSEEVPQQIEDFVALEEQLKNEPNFGEVRETGKSVGERINISDENLLSMYAAASQLFEDKNLDEAVEAFTFLTVLAPDLPLLWMELGRVREEMQNFKEAMSAYTMAICTDPTNEDGYQGLTKCCIDTKNYEEALNVFDQSLQLLEEEQEEDEDVENIKQSISEMRDYVAGLLEDKNK